MLPTHIRTDEAFVRSWIRGIAAPTLVIAADPSPPYFTPEMRAGRLDELRDGRVAVIAGGHHLHMEQPEVVGKVLREFL
jgi:pimeloyl-ACP methyl ester carboxylesterase